MRGHAQKRESVFDKAANPAVAWCANKVTASSTKPFDDFHQYEDQSYRSKARNISNQYEHKRPAQCPVLGSVEQFLPTEAELIVQDGKNRHSTLPPFPKSVVENLQSQSLPEWL